MNNYDNLLRGKENNLPLENSDMEKNWAAMETQLNSATQSTLKDAKFNFKKISLIVTVVSLVALVIFITTKNKNVVSTNSNIVIAKSAIQPPMPKINVPYETFMYDAEIGDTLFTKNGSIIIFPKNAVLNNKGEIVTGKIEVRTREFNDPLDYYMAGIPMTYDSAGVKYTFVSSGMIDIKAYQKNELLFVNPSAKPQLNLVSTNNEKNTNLYVLDTTTGQWINKGKDEVNDVAESPKQNKPNTIALSPNEPISQSQNIAKAKEIPESDASIKPIMPEKASGKNATIEIIIDPASFKELLAYDKLKFEVLDRSIEIVGEDSKTEWDNVELIRTDAGKGYIAKFSLGQKSVQYKVKPVLEGKNYDDALTVYNEKIKTYYDLQKNRVSNEQKQQDTFALQEKKIDEENKKTAANNEVVIAKNKITEIENKRIEELNVLIIARNERLKERKKRNDSMRLIWEKDNRSLALKENLIRSFDIDGFGYWNCDQPTFPGGVPISATFIDDKNNILNFNYINAASFGVNRILAYYNSNITVLPNTNHTMWSVYEKQFYYLTFREYEKLNIKPETRTCTFKLTKYEGYSKSLSDLKKILYGG